MTYTVGSLCSGYGGLELGLQQAGIDFELGWFSEVDSKAASVMATRHPGVENLGDLTKIEFCPAVDIVTAGFPCQPVSEAGKNKGAYDERWLIEDVCKIGRRSGARRLILENVSGILFSDCGNAFSRVLSALAENGFAAKWTCVRACDVGAPHERLRWFCVADAECERTQISFERQQPTVKMFGSVGTDGSARWGRYSEAIARWEPIVGRAAPDPTDSRQRLNPRFVEWMMGLPDGYVTDVIENRKAAIECLGNGVVPQQAAYALKLLLEQKEKPFEAI